MDERIMFIVYDGEVKFIKSSTMDHREWFLSLGGNMDDYDNVIRGYVLEGMLFFFKANLNYDDEVISFATKMGLRMKQQLNMPDLKICCGIEPGHDGSKWEPILILKDEDLEGYKSEEDIEKEKKELEKEALRQQNTLSNDPIIEFKNNRDDPNFIKFANKFTIIIIVLAIISKLIMIHNKTMMLDNGWNKLLVFVQIGGFTLSLIGYNKKLSKTLIFGLAATIASVVMFDFIDVVIGCLYIAFLADYTNIIKFYDFLKKIKNSGTKLAKDKSKELKSNSNNNHTNNM